MRDLLKSEQPVATLANNWHRLLAPKSVALLGASATKPAPRIAYENLIRHNFSGDIYLVNPKYRELFGHTCVSDLREVGPVDVALVMVGRENVLSAVESSIAAGVGGIIVVSGGFRETGEPRWRDVEVDIAELADAHDIPLIGPNCTGVTSLATNAVMSIAPSPWPLRSGSTSLVMQSGGQLAASCRYLGYLGGGMRTALSLGNASAVDFADVLVALAEDSGTREIVLLIEEISNWARFSLAVRHLIEQGKWVAAVAVGRSKIGREAAATHTGSIAGDHRILTSALAQCGIRVGRSLNTVVSAAALQSRLGPSRADRLGILGISGSSAGLSADLSFFHDSPLPPITSDAVSVLKAVAPSIVASNPLDVAGAPFMDRTRLRRIAKAFMTEGRFDVNIYLPSHGLPDSGTPEHLDVLQCLLDVSVETQTHLIVSQLLPTGVSDDVRESILTHATAAFIPDFESALDSIKVWTSNPLDLLDLSYPVIPDSVRESDAETSSDSSHEQPIGEYQLKGRLKMYSLRSPPNIYITHRNEVAAALTGLGRSVRFPLVVKGVARHIYHKATKGLVALDIHNRLEAADAIEDMWRRVPELDGILIEEHVLEGTDILASITRDPLGLVVALAEGGTAARDETTRAWFGIDPSDEEVETGAAHLLGFLSPRLASSGLATVTRLVRGLEDMLDDLDLTQLEVNPLRLYPDAPGVVLDIVARK